MDISTCMGCRWNRFHVLSSIHYFSSCQRARVIPPFAVTNAKTERGCAFDAWLADTQFVANVIRPTIKQCAHTKIGKPKNSYIGIISIQNRDIICAIFAQRNRMHFFDAIRVTLTRARTVWIYLKRLNASTTTNMDCWPGEIRVAAVSANRLLCMEWSAPNVN